MKATLYKQALLYWLLRRNHRVLPSYIAQPGSIFNRAGKISFFLKKKFAFKKKPQCLKVLWFGLEFTHPYRELVLPISTYMSA